jgi:hypothetical protein
MSRRVFPASIQAILDAHESIVNLTQEQSAALNHPLLQVDSIPSPTAEREALHLLARRFLISPSV